MKGIIAGLCFAAAASAIVAPDPQIFAQLPIDVKRPSKWHIPKVPGLKGIIDYIGNPFRQSTKSENPLDHALANVDRELLREASQPHPQSFEYLNWVEDNKEEVSGEQFDHPPPNSPEHKGFLPHIRLPMPRRRHHTPPRRHGCHQSPARTHGPHFPPPPDHFPPPPGHFPSSHHFPHPPSPGHFPPPSDHFPHPPPSDHFPPPPGHPPHPPHKRPGKRPHWRKGKHHHHLKSNLTIYELISKSNYTKHAAKIIDSDKDLVQLLNSTKANYTVFVPTDLAFKRKPKHLENLSKKALKDIILYHISPGLYPAIRLVFGHTAPTSLELETLGGHPQRVLAKWFGFRHGLKLNFYSTILAANIGAKNGIIHGTNAILFPPPPALFIIDHLPTTFSTFLLGLEKTGLHETLKSAKHTGGTIFAPTNLAFKLLGPRINAFLFSKIGVKYLDALLKYHIVPKHTLYSTAYYNGTKKTDLFAKSDSKPKRPRVHHVDLPTLLNDKTVGVDLIRRGPFVIMRVNKFSFVRFQDGLASDGVIQAVHRLVIPPRPKKKPGVMGTEVPEYWTGEGELTVEELVQRLDPFIDEHERVSVQRLEL